ncbi:MAG: trigger factor [Planctomycetota bacterium]
MADSTATATAEQRVLHKVDVADSGPSRKRLSIEIAAETVDRRLHESVDTLAEQAELPGFRRGHVPRQLIQKRFGTELRNEARDQLVTQAYQQAIEETGLKVVGDPFGANLQEIEVRAGEPLSFGLDVEVLPEFELPKVDGLDLKKPIIEIDDARVDEEVEKICLNEGSLESHESSEAGDYLTGNARMIDGEGTEHYNIEGAVVQVPTGKGDDGQKGMILGVLVDDFATQIGTPKVGDTKTVTTKGPETHEVEALRGKDLTVTFEVSSIDKIIPLAVDELVARFGMSGEDELKQQLRSRLEQRAEVQQRTALRQQVAKHLLESVDFPLPERMTAQQAARAMERRRMELLYRGMDQAEIEKHVAELRAASAQDAQQNLKLFFVLSRVAEEHGVVVSEQEVRGRIAQMAFERGSRPEQFEQELAKSGQIQSVAQQVREHKTLDSIIEKANVKDVPLDEFNAQAAATETA